MDNSDYFIALVLGAFFLFGIVDFLRARSQVRDFYQKNNFVNTGPSNLNTPECSELLQPLKTPALYTGDYKGYKIEHCKANPASRGKFTFNKIQRKHNQTLWSVTKLSSQHSIQPFCIMPKTGPETMFLMLQEEGLEIKDKQEISNRYHIRANNPDALNQLAPDIENFLLQPELISIECLDNTVIIKRPWPVVHFERNFFAELDCAVTIAQTLQTTPETG